MTSVMGELVRVKSAAKRLLPPPERDLLSVAFKNRLTSFRGTLRMLAIVAEHETVPVHLTAVQTYAREMEASVLTVATELLTLAFDHAIPVADDALAAARAAGAAPAAADAGSVGGGDGGVTAEAPRATVQDSVDSLVFWYKLAADYCRYVSECHTDPATVAKHSDLALSYYSKARSFALTFQGPASPSALGIVLNFAVFLFEIRRCELEAFDLAKAALEDAAAALAVSAARKEGKDATGNSEGDGSGGTTEVEATRAEAEAVMALIRENLHVWGQVLKLATMKV